MRPIRNRVVRAAALAALLLAALIGQASPALAGGGDHQRNISISPDDGGGVLFLHWSSPDDGGGVLQLLSSPDDGGVVLNP